MRKKRVIFLLYTLFYCFFGTSGFVHAQLTVVEGSAMNMTPQQLVQNYLVGPGITVTNVTFNGSSSLITSQQIGTFETAGTATAQLGLTGGILMTCGKASIAIGPNNNAGAGSSTGGSGDPDLNSIAGTSTFDKAVIEFDFIPQYDTMRFRYVFGSEEFFEYCNQYNDAFGFFLSGPGISGSYSNNAVNIALMPGSTILPVTINNICANQFSRWDNTGGQYYQYDGLTHVFTAKYVVQPCSTYHIKLAIGDAVDHIYDSGVFLEKNSFTSPGVQMSTSGAIPALGNKAYEGCNDVTVSFKLSTPLNYTYRAHYTITGTAVNGVDYTSIPDSISFPPGVDSVYLVIHPILDNTTEGMETVIITINQINCNGLINADTVRIYDYTSLEVQPLRDTTVCHGSILHFKAIATGGMRPYDYAWNGIPGDSVLTVVPPVGTDPYILRVKDVCQVPLFDTAIVIVNPKPIADAGSTVTIPNGTSVTLAGNASGGLGYYSYEWTSNPPGFHSSLQNPNTGNLYLTTIFTLLVTDMVSGCISNPAQVIVIVEGGPLSANPVAQPDEICYGDATQLYALAGGGSGLYTYAWTSTPSGFTSTNPDPMVTPLQNTTYHLTVNDGFNNVSGNTQVTVNPLPVIMLGPADSNVCIYDTVTLDAGNPGALYEWSNGAETRTITVSSTGITYEIQTYTVWVTDTEGCSDSSVINLVFSFNACLGANEKGEEIEFGVYPNPSDGTMRIQLMPEGSSLSLEIYNLLGTRVYRCEMQCSPGRPWEKELDVSFLPPGFYLLRILGNGKSGTRRIIIQ